MDNDTFIAVIKYFKSVSKPCSVSISTDDNIFRSRSYITLKCPLDEHNNLIFKREIDKKSIVNGKIIINGIYYNIN